MVRMIGCRVGPEEDERHDERDHDHQGDRGGDAQPGDQPSWVGASADAGQLEQLLEQAGSVVLSLGGGQPLFPAGCHLFGLFAFGSAVDRELGPALGPEVMGLARFLERRWAGEVGE